MSPFLLDILAQLVSKNPYFRCNFAGKAGDTVKVSWIDNRGVKRVDEDLVKA